MTKTFKQTLTSKGWYEPNIIYAMARMGVGKHSKTVDILGGFWPAEVAALAINLAAIEASTMTDPPNDVPLWAVDNVNYSHLTKALQEYTGTTVKSFSVTEDGSRVEPMYPAGMSEGYPPHKPKGVFAGEHRAQSENATTVSLGSTDDDAEIFATDDEVKNHVRGKLLDAISTPDTFQPSINDQYDAMRYAQEQMAAEEVSDATQAEIAFNGLIYEARKMIIELHHSSSDDVEWSQDDDQVLRTVEDWITDRVKRGY